MVSPTVRSKNFVGVELAHIIHERVARRCFGKVCPVTFDVAVASRAEKCQPGKEGGKIVFRSICVAKLLFIRD